MSQRINLLHITTSLSAYGGIEETLRILCRGLDPDLFRIGVCTIKDHPGEVLRTFREMDVEIFCLGRKGYFFDLLTTIRTLRLIRKFKADIVHTHTNKGNLHGRLAAFLARKPSIVTTHHDLGDIGFSKNPALKMQRRSHVHEISGLDAYNWVYRVLYPWLNIKLNALNAKIITVSNAVRSVYTGAAGNQDDQRFETVYAPYDDTVFTLQPKGLGHPKTILGTVGRFIGQKGHGYLLQAMKLLVQSHPNLELKIIGSGPMRTALERFIKKNDLMSFVEISDPLPHDARLYSGIDIYVQPSVSEGCSITLMEAMGLGIPVVATDMGGPGELIIADKTGILVPSQNPPAIKNAVLDLMADKRSAMELGIAGHRRVRQQFAAGIFIRKMTRIYQNLVGSSSEY